MLLIFYLKQWSSGEHLEHFSQANTDFAIKRIKEIHRGIEIAYNVKIEENLEVMYPPVTMMKSYIINF